MHPLSKAKQRLILEFAADPSLSARDIAGKVGCSKTTITNYINKLLPDKENPRGGRPKKLTPQDERHILTQIRTGATKDASHMT
ncbi:hypothetical protein PQX77_020588 [Marasmius sp. AFHP31]|nr:hypothetical protein PQX77_020588 [Marasmius sp. AFHP31]